MLGQIYYYWVTLEQARPQGMTHSSMFDWIWQLMPDYGLAAEKGYLAAIGALVAVIGIMSRAIIVLWRDNKEKAKEAIDRERMYSDSMKSLAIPIERLVTLIENSK